MNFDVKLNNAYKDFAEKLISPEGKNIISKSQPDLKITSSMDFFTKEGEILETSEQTLDDILYRGSKAAKNIAKKLKDAKFMQKLQKQCETYVLENPD